MKHSKLLLWYVAVVVFIVDQITKWFVRSNQINIEVTSFFSLRFIKNTGAAFGLFPGSNLLLIVAACILLLTFIYYYSKIPHDRLTMVALGLIIGGGLGNVMDRIFDGYVTDFIAFSFWPAFNIADSAITVAVVLYLYNEFFSKNKKASK